MTRTQKLWLTVATIFQLLTAAIHSLSYFFDTIPANETEKQFLDLFNNYRTDMGAGFQPSSAEMFLCFSISFTLLFVFGGLVNITLLKSQAALSLVKTIFGIQTFIYGVIFIATALLTFLPPIICTGLIFASCLMTFLYLTKKENKLALYAQKIR
ncbi:MAG: hypothetical protein V4717_02370 [Bacteroidota bacterium]